ncbi:type IV toxin-antitoxin system AbiEi family antitoxin domain-containing protein [uncultured Desulfosarcina sp.]|uniref:type IV toxin-antitoxin system AbiEi family antitoxin domain-containing protein n=1 Tax=uncultured Desulfosarcina sp. TaxID=218289 RepID=UPI0029C710FE|nr:type IV toxin-antitoxin system AbiEi family antitoxin domain-containing protein [uncultured Desulfosarcina sp.]
MEQTLPEGQLVDRAWLQARGFNRPRVDYALRAGKLTAVAHGIYRRPGPALKWEHVVYSLNQMGYPVRVGGRTALELQGLAHYLPLGDTQYIDLYGGRKVPIWVQSFQASFRFTIHTPQLFGPLPEAAVHHRPFGAWDWPIPFSRPELALLELMAGVRHGADFSMADKFFEAAVNLRPGLLRDLLLSCTQVKAKRLFLWFSDRHGHAWRQALDTQGVDLGRGKRLLVRGGAYDAAYQITVPREMAVSEEQSIY